MVQEGDTLTRVYDVDGVQVIHRMVPESEVVAVNLYLLGGARQVTEGTAGIEPLLLRVSEHGTRSYPGLGARRALARTGSWMFVEPEADWTVFGMRGSVSAFDSTWAVFTDRLMHPVLDTAAVEIERAKMIASARARLSDPDERVRIIAQAAALREHPYRHDVRGTETSLGQIAVADLKAYLTEQVVKSRVLLVVVGNIQVERLRAAVSGTIGQLRAGNYVWEMPLAWAGSEPSVTAVAEPIPTDYILGYFGGPLASAEDHAAFRVAVVALSSFISVRAREKGYSYAARAMFLDRAASGGGIYFSTDFTKECIEIANTAIDVLQNVVFIRSDLRDYARSSVFDYYVQSETSGEQADVIGRVFLYRGVLPSPQEHVDGLMGVSGSDVKSAANRYFKNIQYVLLGDTTAVPRREMTKH